MGFEAGRFAEVLGVVARQDSGYQASGFSRLKSEPFVRPNLGLDLDYYSCEWGDES